MLPIKAVVVDDHPFLRIAVKTILLQNNYNVVAEADNGIDAMNILRLHQPELLILDLGIPQLDGLEVIRRATDRYPNLKIVVLTAQEPALYAVRCKESGAHAILSKADDLERLSQTAKQVLAGKLVFPQSEYYGESLANSEAELLASLSNRELQILRLLCVGKANKDIADEVAISYKTVSSHKTNILSKLNLNSTVDLADFARRNNLL